jgi:hypothetical protein
MQPAIDSLPRLLSTIHGRNTDGGAHGRRAETASSPGVCAWGGTSADAQPFGPSISSGRTKRLKSSDETRPKASAD